MPVMTIPRKYYPGIYPGKRYDPAEVANLYIKTWEQKRLGKKSDASQSVEFPPAICFARQIGVGALEIADILAARLGWRVADRLILEEMAGSSEVTHKKEQGAYFRKLTGKRERPSVEFDLVINCDHIANPARAADIVETAFQCKFGQ